jgi:hypothetical protein
MSEIYLHWEEKIKEQTKTPPTQEFARDKKRHARDPVFSLGDLEGDSKPLVGLTISGESCLATPGDTPSPGVHALLAATLPSMATANHRLACSTLVSKETLVPDLGVVRR